MVYIGVSNATTPTGKNLQGITARNVYMTSTSKSAEELLAESRALRQAFIPGNAVANYQLISPPKALPWQYWYCQILAPENFQWQDVIVNIYRPNAPPVGYSAPVGTTVIVHGHSREERCFSKHRCHILGFEGGQNAD